MVTLIMMMVIRPLNICAVTGVFDFTWSRDRKLEGGKIRSEKQEEGKSIVSSPSITDMLEHFVSETGLTENLELPPEFCRLIWAE